MRMGKSMFAQLARASNMAVQSGTIVTNLRCVCSSSPSVNSEMIQCARCRFIQHSVCIGESRKLVPYECPRCLLARLDPLMFVDPTRENAVRAGPTLIPTFEASFASQPVGVQICILSFSAGGEFMDPRGKHRLHVRCIRLDGKSAEHCWPLMGQLILNGRVVETFQVPKDVHGHKRKDVPHFLKPDELRHGPNQLVVQRTRTLAGLSEPQRQALRVDEQGVYVVAVVDAESLTSEELIRKVAETCRPTVEESKRKFMQRVSRQYQAANSDEDCLCEEPALEVPFADPYLPGTMMQIPAYGNTCKHIQDFDLARFIRMNEHMRQWKCPHCSERAYELEVDTYLEQLFKEIKRAGIEPEKITIDKAGVLTVNGRYVANYKDGMFSLVNQEQRKLAFGPRRRQGGAHESYREPKAGTCQSPVPPPVLASAAAAFPAPRGGQG